MITNEKQRLVTEDWLARFQADLVRYADPGFMAGANPLFKRAVIDAAQSQVAILQAELREYAQRQSRRISLFFAWYDFWIGTYYDRENQVLYICPLPMVMIKVQIRK